MEQEDDEFNLELELDDDNNLSSFTMSFVIENGEAIFPNSDLKFDKQGVKKSGTDKSQLIVQIKAKDIQFEEALGSGQGGFVYRAIYKPQNMPIAVKQVNIIDKASRHQMLNDLKVLLIGAKSDYIVKCFGAYFEPQNTSINIILEYMDIGSLSNFINILKEINSRPQFKNDPLIDEGVLCNICYQILKGIDFLHRERKQLHRDIKPDNILVNTLGQIKLGDFGLARDIDKTYDIAKTFLGTMLYMSPERLNGDPYSYGGDIWGIGMLIYEFVTGTLPFNLKVNIPYMQLVQIVNQEEINQFPQNFSYSEELKDFIKQFLIKDVTQRPSAKQLLEHDWIKKYKIDEETYKQKFQMILFRYQNQNNSFLSENTKIINDMLNENHSMHQNQQASDQQYQQQQQQQQQQYNQMNDYNNNSNFNNNQSSLKFINQTLSNNGQFLQNIQNQNNIDTEQ